MFFDGGVRSGEDVLKASASGADFVFIGRILQFAIAAAGEEGLNRLWDVLSEELSIAMAQTGLRDLRCESVASAACRQIPGRLGFLAIVPWIRI